MAGIVGISEATSLAIHAMVMIAAQPEDMVSVKSIAQTFTVSNAHLAKVMQRLARWGLVTSSRGPAGGFKLSRPAGQITLLEIYECMESTLETRPCLLSESICSGSACLLGDTIAKVNAQVKKALANTTLEDLTRSYLDRRKGEGA